MKKFTAKQQRDIDRINGYLELFDRASANHDTDDPKGNFQDAGGTADVILRTLLTNPQTQLEMRRCLIAAFCESESFKMTQSIYKHVLKLKDFTPDEVTKMRQACVFNRNVSEAYNVAEAVFAKIGRPPQSAESLDEDVPF